MAVDFLKKEFVMDRFADWALGKVAKDLHFYYEESQQILERGGEMGKVRTVLRAELREALIPHKGRRIMLFAHSMGTIIAYDVLRDRPFWRSHRFQVPPLRHHRLAAGVAAREGQDFGRIKTMPLCEHRAWSPNVG